MRKYQNKLVSTSFQFGKKAKAWNRIKFFNDCDSIDGIFD